MGTVAIVGWTGRGSLESLRDSAAAVLRSGGLEARVRGVGDCIIVGGPHPVEAAAALGWLPGASWTAVGINVPASGQLAKSVGALARKYLAPGDRFSVSADGSGGASASDLVGTVTAAILESVKGSRTSERSARVKFRAVSLGAQRVVGVEIGAGPGGVAGGSGRAFCLASGGKHSSVTAWKAVLAGYEVTLVHAKQSDRGLAKVAQLYSELSHRSDPRPLRLEVLGGRSTPSALAWWASKARSGPVFGGFHIGCSSPPRLLRGVAGSPLYLTGEEWFDSEFVALGQRGADESQEWKPDAAEPAEVTRFGGVRADSHEVLDGLR